MIDILKDYDDNKNKFDSLSKTLKSLIESLLISEGVTIHSISSRVKDKVSLENKLIKKQKYEKIEDITDVIGVRVITNYSDEVDKIARIIESEFLIDSINSIDKRKSLAPDKFGYLSLHYVISLSEGRCNLKEYGIFRGLKAELQVRSILQHTWAEIEHDIGYKSSKEVPDHIRRKFSQLAGLLELADAQFITIREDLLDYRESTVVNIENLSEGVAIDKITLTEYLKNSETVKSINRELQEEHGINIRDNVSVSFDSAMKELDYFNIDYIDKLDALINDNKNFIIRRIQNLNNISAGSKYTPLVFPAAIIITALSQSIASKEKDITSIMQYLRDLRPNLEEEKMLSLANKLILTQEQ